MRKKFIKGKVTFEAAMKVTHADREPTDAKYLEGEFYVYDIDGKVYADVGLTANYDYYQCVLLPIKESFDELEEYKEHKEVQLWNRYQ